MTSNEKNADGAARGIAQCHGSYEMRGTQVQAPHVSSRRRIQGIGIAATGVAATIWLVGAVWAWQVIG